MSVMNSAFSASFSSVRKSCIFISCVPNSIWTLLFIFGRKMLNRIIAMIVIIRIEIIDIVIILIVFLFDFGFVVVFFCSVFGCSVFYCCLWNVFRYSFFLFCSFLSSPFAIIILYVCFFYNIIFVIFDYVWLCLGFLS